METEIDIGIQFIFIFKFNFNFSGIFEHKAINELHQDIEDFYCRGIPFERLERRKLYMHDLCLSPCNNQF